MRVGKREWGPLSRTTAWRAGRFWEDMERPVKVFIQKADKRTPVEVEERIEVGRKRLWFEEKPTAKQQEQEEEGEIQPREENPGVEEVPRMSSRPSG